METITLTKLNVLKAYKNATKDQKKFLADLVGDFNVSGNIMDYVKTFPDAVTVTGSGGIESLGVSKHANSIDAYKMLIIIAEALNEGWIPNWEDSNEYKWYPWFKMKGGFGFSDSDCSYACSNTIVGSRLCFKSEELANYAGKQFETIYKDFLTL